MIKKIIDIVSIYFTNISQVRKINKEKNCNISLKSTIDSRSEFGGRNIVGAGTILKETYIGYATYIASSCTLTRTHIGKYCSIGSNVKVIVGNHPTDKHVSTHPLFYTNTNFSGLYYGCDNTFKENKYVNGSSDTLFCSIGNDVWVAQDVRILSGVSIGDGAIIASGAIVTKDIPPYAIVGGVPAKIIKYRFTENEIKFLKEIKWWDKSEEWLKYNIKFFRDIKLFSKDIKE